MRRSAWVIGLLVLCGSAVAAHAQEPEPAPATVSLAGEACAVLPFDPDRVSAILALELELEGLVLVAAGGEVLLRYAPVTCTPGVTRFNISVEQGGAVQAGEALLDAVALAAVPRALALHLVEMLRERPRTDAAATDATQLTQPTGQIDATDATAEGPVANPVHGPPDAVAGTAPGAPPADNPSEDLSDTRSPFRLGGVLNTRNTPDSGAFLGGGRLVLDLGFGSELPLAMRVDAGFALGKARGDVTLGVIDAGVGLFLRAVAADILDLRFGPRLSVGHAFHIGAGERRSEDVQVAVGLRVGGGLRLARGVDLLLEAEVGANLVDLELDVAGERSGLVGAYWAVDVGVAFDL